MSATATATHDGVSAATGNRGPLGLCRDLWLIAWTVLIEALRRKEIYAIVLVSTVLIITVMMMDFFQLEGITKFYREIALTVMSAATAVTVIVLAARQLPREFEKRTIYPLLARPITRWSFLAGKFAGVMLAAAFCFALFMAIYLAGNWWLGGTVPVGLFAQYIYLQMLMFAILAALCFWLSLLVNFDAAVTMGLLFYAFCSTFVSITTYIYDDLGALGQLAVRVFTFAAPQLPLFDLSGKAIHQTQRGVAGTLWDPLSWGTMSALTAYGFFFAGLYFVLAMVWFRRRPL